MSSLRPFLLILSLLLWGAASGEEPVYPPGEDTSWPILVFSDPDSFSARYERFYRFHFDVSTEKLPVWTELDPDSLVPGEHLLARPARIEGNEAAILERLRDLVSFTDEVGMTQFSPEPRFSAEYFILGRRKGAVTLVPYDVLGVRDTLVDMEAVQYLARRDAFLTRDEDTEAVVVLGRGNITEVDLWHPVLAREVLHAHTIPGNINPTGYLEFTEGSDRDLILTSYRFQDPIRRLELLKEN